FEELMTPTSVAGGVYAKIQEKCAAKGACYLPAKWNNVDGGHFFTLKVRLGKNNTYIFSFLDYGAGSAYHSVALHGKTKTKSSLASDEFTLSCEETLDFITTVIQIKHDIK